MKEEKCISGEEIIASAAAAAISLARCKDEEEIRLLAKFLNEVSHNLYIIADRRRDCKKE